MASKGGGIVRRSIIKTYVRRNRRSDGSGPSQ